MSKHEDKVAIVVGGGGGLGLAIAAKLADEGASVVVMDYTLELAAKAAARLSASSNGKFVPIAVDVADPASVKAAFSEFDKHFQKLDYLINSAGVREIKSIYDLNPEEWSRVVAINLSGPFYCCKEAAHRMRERRQGSIVSIASVAGLVGITRRPAYTATKHGVVGLTKNLARDLGPDGIRVNAVAPGTIRTPLTEAYYSDQTFLDGLDELVPLGSTGGVPVDVGDAVSFLCSLEAKFISGVVLPVDGGWVSSKAYTVGAGGKAYLGQSSKA